MIHRRIIYGICLIAVFALNIFYVEYQFFFLLIMMLLIPALSWIMLSVSRVGISMQLSASNRIVSHGERARISITISDSMNFFLANAEAKAVIKYSETNISSVEKLTFVAEKNGIKADLSIVPLHFGEVSISIEDVSIFDYLGLFSCKKSFTGTQKVYIMPPLFALSSDEHNVMEITDDASVAVNSVVGDGEELYDLKEMTEGDDVRKIHWKMSANHPDEEFVIKQYAQIEEQKNYILVDLSLKTDNNSVDEDVERFRGVLDKIYQMTLSLANYYLEKGREPALVFWNEKKDQISIVSIKDMNDFKSAAVEMMRTRCSVSALKKTCNDFRLIINVNNSNPIIVTADNIKSDTFHVVNVLKMSSNEVFK